MNSQIRARFVARNVHISSVEFFADSPLLVFEHEGDRKTAVIKIAEVDMVSELYEVGERTMLFYSYGIALFEGKYCLMLFVDAGL